MEYRVWKDNCDNVWLWNGTIMYLYNKSWSPLVARNYGPDDLIAEYSSNDKMGNSIGTVLDFVELADAEKQKWIDSYVGLVEVNSNSGI